MKLENVKEFIKTTKASKSKIYRFYKKNEDLWSETKFKNNKRLFPIEHARYFDSEIMFDENKILRQENKSMKNLINGLMDKDSLQTTLWYKEWTWFITVAYKSERNKKSCYRMITSCYDELIKKYGDITEIRFFFTTEKFGDRNGHHNHMVVYIKEERLHEKIMNDIYEYFCFDKVNFGIYDKFKAAIFYSCKDGLVNEDWDYLSNKKEK